MIITNSSFNDNTTIRDTVVFNKYLPENKFTVIHNNDEIIITTDYPVSNCWYVLNYQDKFIFSNIIGEILSFANSYNISLTKDVESCKKYLTEGKSSGKTYFLECSCIEDYREIHISRNGEYRVIPYDFKSYYKDPKENYDQIKTFLKKYSNIINTMIDDKIFVPTITGGIDSRTMIGLYRNRLNELDNYYLKSVKSDGKDHSEKGIAEIEISKEVLNKLNCNLNRVEKLGICKTVSSRLNEIQRKENCNELEKFWINKVIKHDPPSCNIIKMNTDPLYLELRTEQNLYKCLFALLLIPDLLDIPIISESEAFYENGPYNFYDEYSHVLPRAKEIMDYWGEDKCKNILL